MRTPLAIAVVAASLAACANMSDPPPRSAAPAQAQISAEVRAAQLNLRSLGFYNGPLDGLWGPETSAAVERFQQSHAMSVTGRLDRLTMVALNDATRPEPVMVSSADDVRRVQDRLAELGFYRGPVDGVWGTDTQAALERFQRARDLQVGGLTRPTVVAMNLDPNVFASTSASRTTSSAGRTPLREPGAYPLQPRVVRNVQDRLRELGFYDGSVDGVWGPSTRTALVDFQRSRGLETTGDLTPATASVLGFDPNNLLASARK